MCADTDLIEPYAVQEVYVDGIADIQDLGSCFRAVYYTLVRMDGGEMRRVVAAKIVRPKTSLGQDQPQWRNFFSNHYHSAAIGDSSQASAETSPRENVLMLSTASQSGRTKPRL